MKSIAPHRTSTTSKANATRVAGGTSSQHLLQRQVAQMMIGGGRKVGDKIIEPATYDIFTITAVNIDSYNLRHDRTHRDELGVAFDNPAYELLKKKSKRREESGIRNALKRKFLTANSRFNYFRTHSAYKIQSGVNRYKDPDGTVTAPYADSSANAFNKKNYEDFWENEVIRSNDFFGRNVESYGTYLRINTGSGFIRPDLWNDRTAVANRGKTLGVNANRSHSYIFLNPSDVSSNSENFVTDTRGGGKTPTTELSTAFSKLGKGDSHKDIVHLMKTLAGGGKVDDIDTAELNRLITATPYNQTWLASKFRFQGKHEWIPSNMVYEVIKKAEDDSKNTKWIDLQEKLTSNTGDLIFKPSKAMPDSEVHSTKPSLQGHSGAIYGQRTSKSNKPLTQGQNGFHNKLREKFRLATTPEDCADKLKTVAQAWIWNNEDASAVHDKHSRKGGTHTATNTATLKLAQPTAYSRVMGKFESVKTDL